MAKKTKISDKLKFVDCEGTGSTIPELMEERISQGKPVNGSFGGVFNTPTEKARFTFLKPKGASSIGNSPSINFLPGDMPGNDASGMGVTGAPSETIDIVVGRMASANGGEGPSDGMFGGNSFGADAARIYISRLTKSDFNFGIDRRENEDRPEQPRSAIVVKADKVRIIGREGVKIVTGGARGTIFGGPYPNGERNSLGGKIPYAAKIDLIAGNHCGEDPGYMPGGMEPAPTDPGLMSVSSQHIGKPKYLQPITKGANMIMCITDILDILDDVMDTINKIASTNIAVFGAISTAVPWIDLSAATISTTIYANTPCWKARLRVMGVRLHYLGSRSMYRIASRNVNTT